MKKTILVTAALIFTACNDAPKDSVSYINNPEIAAKGAQTAKAFIESIKPVLESEMHKDPSGVGAMNMCSNDAMRLTSDYNAQLPAGTSVRRTALKYRNEANKPDATDAAVMEKFTATKDFDKPLVVDMNSSYRVYKALPMMKPCMSCHGDAVSAEVKSVIAQKYPNDLAVGFKEGDLRGVIVTEIKK